MRRFVEEADRGQWTLLPECLDDFIDESNPVRVIDVFVDALDLDLAEISFEGVEPAATGWPSYMCSVRRTLPRDGPPRDGERCHRWQQVQDPDCVKTRMLRLQGAAGWLMKPSLCPDCLHQTTHAQNADYPFHVVGQDV
jgi:hypothetical protein